jgi:hypothetical protein
VGFSAFMVVGALVVAHRPGNAIGWIFSAIALLAFTGQLASEYTNYAYVTHPGPCLAGSLPPGMAHGCGIWSSRWR